MPLERQDAKIILLENFIHNGKNLQRRREQKMKEIQRPNYLQQLLDKRENGLIKVITGIRRCGKSYLLDPIFKNALLGNGVAPDHIIKIELDRESSVRFHHDSHALDQYIHSLIHDNEMHYLILDEIQLVDGFEWLLNGLLYEKNIDIYVTGSNSRFLSSDIITEFRGRGDQVRIHPLSFCEYYSAALGDKNESLNEYLTYGGLPPVMAQKGDMGKSRYLTDLFSQTYLKDIVARNRVQRTDILDALVYMLASAVGSLTNPQKLFDTFKSKGEKELSLGTLNSYLSHLENAFIVEKAMKYDVKGKKYIGTPFKFYFEDLGLRNAKLNFRQQEETHLMENVIYNELVIRGYNVDVGIVTLREEQKRIQTEVDFVCNAGNQRYYVQSALNLSGEEKTDQEMRPLRHIPDSFKKIIVVRNQIKPWRTDDGFLVVGLIDFLLNQNSLNL